MFISAEPYVAPLLTKYFETKREAEDFLLNNCPHLEPVILRPGLVWHPQERQWAVPLGLAADLGHKVNQNVIKHLPLNEYVQPLLPQSGSINLGRLADFAIKGALGELDGASKDNIWSTEMMNKDH